MKEWVKCYGNCFRDLGSLGLLFCKLSITYLVLLTQLFFSLFIF